MNLIRSAKSGNDWTRNELAAYRIEIHREDPLIFFGVQALPQPQVDPELLTSLDATQAASDSNAELLHLLDMAMTPRSGDSAVNDFVAGLFRALGYAKRNRVARTQRALSLFIYGEFGQAQTDVCIIDRDRNDILLLVQEDKRFKEGEGVDPEAQLIAQAVAAFAFNNEQRAKADMEPLDGKIMPGITMVGTTPTFYKIPVTRALLQHVAQGTYPPEPATRVTYCQPPVPRPARRYSEGMKPLDNRRQILSCYEAFKVIVGI
ncbi:hypothetical protein D9756_007804 [Leucocoprinus leucothites]|uniref:Uncharacterized protein n=1 Tax=Leucocoprinus leucothites TaxID=201217 RepID=A0A8H5FXG5_9AGAR|nr:hypothetical protein D9756_007804 [Leucoagaricus leucothites]